MASRRKRAMTARLIRPANSSTVFGGFSAQSVADRIQDSQAKLVITADGGFRRGAVVPLKPAPVAQGGTA